MALRNLIVNCVEGDFTPETMKSIVGMAERRLELEGEKLSVKKKVINVMVEVLQNVARHSDNDYSGATFLVGHEHNQYSVMSGNRVRNENLPALERALSHINSLDKDGLKDLYQETIRNPTNSDKDGAGLGLVEMARKSGEKLEWAFEPMNDEFSFFSLKVNIAKSRE
ncbi:MAG TPA: SiaB family protein kinase [Cyclobacteriaceae bacterium]|nr:SiaB family protein kinase [Cyclobacteriaceae bacterium]